MARRVLVALSLAASLAACPRSVPSSERDAALVGPDAGGAPDAGEAPDAQMPPDAAAPAPCDGWSTPSWASREPDAGSAFAFTCGATSLVVTVYDEGTLRLRYQGGGKPDRSFAVTGAPLPATVRAGGPDDQFGICADAITLTVYPDCRVRATQADGTVVAEDAEGGGYFENASGLRGVKRALHADEHFYGLGEKTGPLDKLGLAVEMRNTDAYDSTFGGWPPTADPLYQSIPFYVGLAGASAYGVFLDNSYRTRFDLGAADPASAVVTADDGVIDQYLFAGPAMADVLRRYTALTGRAPLPPLWTLGYHQSRWGYSPDTAVKDVCQQFRDRQIPADGIWLDIQHLDGFRSFTWDPTTFPDAQGLVAGLEAQGFKTTVIVDPGIKVDPAWSVYTQGVAGSHFLLGGDGTPFVGQVWPGAAAFPDFSAAATRAWWAGLPAGDVGLGVRGLWIDMNEPATFDAANSQTVPDTLAADGDGQATTMAEVHNAYALEEARATFQGMLDAAPDRRPFLLTRAGFAGIQRYSAVWTGDSASSWPTLQATLPMLLGLGVSGVGFVGSDVGGYSGQADAEMFARWVQLGAISPFFRGHTADTGNHQEPWVFGTEVEDISRAEIGWRYQRLPYLYSLFYETSQSGTPALRPLVFEFAADPLTRTLGDEAMLGPWLLLAPVLEQGAATRSVYLPAGRWFEALSSAVHEGPVTFDQGLTLAALPTFVREGAIIPHQDTLQYVGEKALTTLELDVYPSETPSSFTLYEDDGDSLAFQSGVYSRVVYQLQRSATGATLSAGAREGSFAPGARTLLVRVHRVDHTPGAIALDGQPLAASASEDALRSSGQGFFWDAEDLSLLVAFPDRAGFSLSLQYDPSLVAAAPAVDVSFQVAVPAGTPASAPICIASSANSWAQQPLSWATPGTLAQGTLSVPRGEWFFYKYTRCDWTTVEKWPGCQEASNRYGFGAAHPERQDTVAIWADSCP